ncbi:MAG TPA: hypothetical protein VJ656_06605 [Pyrinomonadaceae bacterium]|nr:hypothetical protein [Pyrinomonadaceae bacterium]
MKKFFRAMSCRLTSSAVLAVIIGSLCFSAGEGLRLAPFSVSQLTENAETSQYGPLDVPAQPQKRSKRQALDLACPDSDESRKVAVIPFSYLFDYETAGTGSLLFIPRPEGRAPPSFS